MRPRLSPYVKVIFVLLALTLSQCGKKSKSASVKVSAVPSQPIVLLADVPINQNGTTVTIKGPWFKFAVNIDNESTDPLTIVALHIEVTGVDNTGSLNTVKEDFTPETYDYSNTTLSCNYGDFGQFTAGQSTELYFTPSGTLGCGAGTATFFASALPLPANPDIINYSVKVVPEGYFGTRGDPTDRFDGFGVITTR